MRIVVTGGTGSIGRRLVPALVARGDRVTLVTRRPRDARRLLAQLDATDATGRRDATAGASAGAGSSAAEVEIVAGDCQFPGPWQRAIDGADAVVHLAGAGVADKRWSRSHREAIERSRVESTHQVVVAIEEASARPPTFVSASASGFYGDTGDEFATERFPAGKGFLADLCVRWEEESRRAEALGVRVVRARIGIVLDENGPALRRLLPWFRAGLGAILGNGQQYVPWIHHRDCVTALLRTLDRRTLLGPVNVTAPLPCQQKEFARALGKAVLRPVFVIAPRLLARAVVGAMADELYRSQRVLPKALLDDGMTFEAESIERAMELLLEEEAESAPQPARRQRLVAGERARGTLPRPPRPATRPRMLIVSAEAVIADDDGRPRPGVREAIRAASSHGCAVVVACERSSIGTSWLLADPLLHPIAIVSNGAVLWNEREGAAAYVERIEGATLAAVLLAVRRAAPSIAVVYEGDHWLASDAEAPPGFGPLTLRLGRNEVPPKPVARVHLIGTPEEVAAARAAVEAPFWRERKIALFARGAMRLIVTSPLVDRAVAAQRIARKLGAARDEIMAITGTLDDLGLADWCGFAVATADAPDPVRRLAGATLEPSDDPFGDAVERFLIR